MQGYAIWQPGLPPRIEMREVAGSPFLLLWAGRSGYFSRRKLRRLARAAYDRGVRSVTPEQDFPVQLLQGTPLRIDDPLPLRRAMLEEILACVCRQRSWQMRQMTVRITAAMTDASVRSAAELIARRCRHLQLDTGWGQAELERALRWRYGLCAGGGGAPQLQLSFDGRGGLDTLFLDDAHAYSGQVTYAVAEPYRAGWEELPCSEALLSALWRGGQLAADEIQVKRVEFTA